MSIKTNEMTPHKNKFDVTDCKVYFFDIETMEVPKEYTQVNVMYHVHQVKTEKEADYSVQPPQGPKLHYKYTSESGREKAKSNQRTNNTEAVTNYDCLIASGKENLIVEFSLN